MTDSQKKDHPDQAIDTKVPTKTVNKKAFEELQEQYADEAEAELKKILGEDS